MATITTRAGKGAALTHLEVDNNFTGLNTELGQKEVASNKSVANGYASLDAGGKVPSAQLPAIAITDTFVVASQAAMLAVTAEKGDVAVRTDLNKSFILVDSPASTLANWQELLTPTDAVTSVNGKTGVVSLVASDVSAAPTTRSVSAGTGLSGGGNLSADRTISLANTAVSPGSYGGASSVGTFTVDAQGRLTAAASTNIAIANTAVSGLGTMSTQSANNVSVTGGTINNAIIGGTTPVAGSFTTLAASGVSTFSAGSAAAPSITTTGDTNTGIFFPAADTIAFTEGGVESLRINSSGNVGIGTSSPSARLDVQGILAVSNSSASYWGIDRDNSSGALTFSDSTTQRLELTTSGNLGIGTTSPATKLEVTGDITQTWAAAMDRFVGSKFSTTYELGLHFIEATRETRIVSKAADSTGLISFYTGVTPTVRAVIDSSGNLGIGTSSPWSQVSIGTPSGGSTGYFGVKDTVHGGDIRFGKESGVNNNAIAGTFSNNDFLFYTNSAERARISAAGAFIVGKTSNTFGGTEGYFCANGDAGDVGYTAQGYLTRVSQLNRQGDDGNLVEFYQDGSVEGAISVSGSTVSYNGGHLSRWSQTADNTKISLLKGTVMSNLDQMAVWEKDGQPLPNEQLNCMKVSDVEGDVNVAGVFVNWDNDDDVFTNDMNIAMTGDMIIRIAQGVVVQRGELLMSAGDGTAKPQGDDIIRSKTVAKVTSNHVTCTYDDGSYCVPCVLMAC